MTMIGQEDPDLCPATTPSERPGGQYACTQEAGHPGEHRATALGGRLLATWDTPEPNGPAIGCLLTEDTDMEAYAALPECQHCDGTGKDLTGSPWEDTRR